jgi:hypothetical protein
MKVASLTLCLVLLVIGNSSVAYSSCLVPEVAQGYELAKAVFVGKVTGITPPRSTDKDAPFSDRVYLVEFEIEKSWKGLPFGSLKVWALQGNETFALPAFVKGERYVVYAEPVIVNEVATDDLKVDECNRTALLPKDAKPRPKTMRTVEVDRKNGTEDLRALDSLLVLKRR